MVCNSFDVYRDSTCIMCIVLVEERGEKVPSPGGREEEYTPPRQGEGN
jgi:hypothetical protein